MQTALTDTPPECRASRSSYVTGCRCARCTEANRAYQRGRSRQLRRPDGRWCPWVDATLVAERIEALSRSGMGVRSIAAAAGVATSTVSRIRAGEVRRARMSVAAAIVAVRCTPADAVNVDATSARRHRDALVAAGWDLHQIAEASGIGVCAAQLRFPRCRAATRDRIEALAELAGARFRGDSLVDPPLPPELFALVSPAAGALRQRG